MCVSARVCVLLVIIWSTFFTCVMGIWRVTMLLISLSYQGKAEIVRCYCNLEECLSNNSSCTSENGGCFSNFLDYRDITKAEHGCLHLLKKERQKQCESTPGSPSWPSTTLLLCCKSDMCNQVLGPKSLLTHSIIGSLISATEAQNNLAGGLGGGGYYDSHRQTNEVWFKAATIVVPICGAMILFLLIALAFKVLRADHVNEDKYCGKTTSNANYADTHVISFKTEELNSDETSKKMPLLYETRQTDRGENFRNFTTARIHFGQNVNILREAENSNKIAKNIENERMNLEKPWYRGREVATTSRIQPEESNNSSGSSNNNHTSCSSSNSSNNNNNSAAGRENEANSTLDVRVDVEDPRPLPVLSLNLDKPECLSSCNIYRSPKTYGQSTFSVNADKMYDKYLL